MANSHHHQNLNNPSISTTSAEVFNEFFELGKQESVSPFLLPDSRTWSINLNLKTTLVAAFFLVISFTLSFLPSFHALSHILLIMVYFLAGVPSLIEAIEDLVDGEINIDILMTIAAFSSFLIGSGIEGALLLVLFALSGSMEDAVTTKAKGALSSLYKLSPTKACIVQQDGTLSERALRDVTIGARVLVKAGQIIPLDGIVIKGTSSVNLVHLTGENLPVTKTIGDTVPAGGRNLEGALTIDITRTSADSTLANIIELVTRAQSSRPVLQRWFDKLSKAYAITIILLATLFAFTLPWILNIPFLGVEGGLYRALTFLIAASPCALIIAIPIAYLSAVSACAWNGILLKGGLTLDALAKCRTIAFDKTGTLTTGELRCTSIEPLFPNSAIDSDMALAIAYALEKNAVHPIASAIMNHAKQIRCTLDLGIENFCSVPGYGLTGSVKLQGEQHNVYIGRPEYIAQKLPEGKKKLLMERVNKIQEEGELLAVLTIDTTPFIFHFQDTPRNKVTDMLIAVKKRGISTVMLTGDHFSSAQRIAKELQITQFHAALSPEDKLRYVSELSETNGLAMIGDGVNDAPALARATVGICMGKVGSSAAIDAADVILLHDNVELLDWLIGKAHQTQTIVTQNLTLATAAILIASLPALGGFIPLWLAVIMHEGGTILVGLNALRLLRR